MPKEEEEERNEKEEVEKGSQSEDEAKEHWKNGNARFQEGNYGEAIKEYEEAIKLKKDYADAYFNKALTEYASDNVFDAREDL